MLDITPAAHARVPRRHAPVMMLIVLAACADELTSPAEAGRVPERASLAKGAKPSATSIAFSVNTDGAQNVMLTDSAGSRIDQLTSGGLDDNPAWSPDRRKIAFVRGDGLERQIYVRSMNGGRETPIGHGMNPSWSPDGREIVFSWIDAGNQDVYVMNADGSNVRRLTTDPASDDQPHWSADGQRIAFASTRTGTLEVFVMNADGTNPIRQTYCGPNYYCAEPKFAPIPGDQRIVFAYHNLPIAGIPVMSAVLTKQLGSVVTGTVWNSGVVGHPVWSPDATKVAFLGTLNGQSTPDIYVTTLATGAIARLTTSLGVVVGSPAWAR